MYKSYYPKASEIERKWVLVDANGQNLGRIATRIAHVLLGKHKPTFTPHMDGGDFVVVINAAKVRLTGSKLDQKKYFSHSGYMGHESFTPVVSADGEGIFLLAFEKFEGATETTPGRIHMRIKRVR